jgi:hypothetical protein
MAHWPLWQCNIGKQTEMSELRHSARANKFVKDATFQLGERAVSWQQDGQSGQMAFADVREVTLNPELTLSRKQAQCVLRDSRGREITLTSHHFESLGVFKSRMDTYTPFVRKMLQQVAAAAPDAKFTLGSTTKMIMALALAFIFAVLFGLLIMAQMGVASFANGALIVAFVATAFAPGLWYIMRGGGGARPFDPYNPPADQIGGHG